MKLELLDKNNRVIRGRISDENDLDSFSVEDEHCCVLGIKDYLYQEGDQIRFTKDSQADYYLVQLDESLAPSLLYITEKEWIFQIPLEEQLRVAMVNTAFKSRQHHLLVRKAYDFEIENEQNLSFNAHDQKEATGAYPHVSANVETREESVFFAKNAIDGKYANCSHGAYPFASWGINQQEDAALTIDFGRLVKVNRIGFLLRSDFPHDSYWKSVEVFFSSGKSMTFNAEKSNSFQVFDFPEETTSQITLTHLKKATDESPFPALTQIEVFGKNKIEKRG